MMQMTRKIAYREGIGDLLAEAGLRAAQKIGRGAEKCITHSKGVLKTNLDLRSSASYAFAHAVASRGADHLRGALPTSLLPGQYEGVAREVYDNTQTCAIADALQLCKFHTPYVRMEIALKEMTELFSVATGIKLDEGEVRDIADRISNVERAFIVREGIGRKDDILVGRYMEEPMHGGPKDGLALNRKKWDETLDEYYDLNGWDKKTGWPTRARLEALGLKDIADELETMGKAGN